MGGFWVRCVMRSPPSWCPRAHPGCEGRKNAPFLTAPRQRDCANPHNHSGPFDGISHGCRLIDGAARQDLDSQKGRLRYSAPHMISPTKERLLGNFLQGRDIERTRDISLESKAERLRYTLQKNMGAPEQEGPPSKITHGDAFFGVGLCTACGECILAYQYVVSRTDRPLRNYTWGRNVDMDTSACARFEGQGTAPLPTTIRAPPTEFLRGAPN